MTNSLWLLLTVLALAGCKSLGADLPSNPPPLFDMEEPAAFLTEPDDEAARATLPLGAYSGVHVEDPAPGGGSRNADPVSLDENDFSLDEDAADSLADDVSSDSPPMNWDGVVVRKVVENSPGDVAGLQADDILRSVVWPGAGERPLNAASGWRGVEDTTPPGTHLTVNYDRAGLTQTATLLLTQRARPRDRLATARYREGLRTGVVLRTATEVEAARVGLAAGGGAVIVGLSRASPFRRAGLKYGDVLVAIDGAEVAHPQVVLDAIRDADEDAVLAVTAVRGEERREGAVALTERAGGLRNVSIPFIYSCGTERGETETSILSGLLLRRATRAAWEWRILWLFSFSGGEADRLEDSE